MINNLSEDQKFREIVKELALGNGFKLKQQENGCDDLNEYVYQFAAALIDNQWIDAFDKPPVFSQEDGSNDVSREIIFKMKFGHGIYHGWYMVRESKEQSQPCMCCGDYDCDNQDEQEPEMEGVFVANVGDEVFDEDSVECYAFLPKLNEE